MGCIRHWIGHQPHSSPQLFQCASEELGNNLLKIDANITSKPTKNLLSEMKSLAVIASSCQRGSQS